MRRGQKIVTLFVILLLLLAVAGGLMIARPYIIDVQRQNAEAALFTMIESGQTEIEIDHLPEMEGEQFSEMEDLGDLPYGEYTLEEIVAPDGYVLDQRKHEVKISENGLSIDGKSRDTFTFVVRNIPVKIPIILHKQDKCGRSPLENAEFKITGNGVCFTLKTDRFGNTELFHLEPGDYSITETAAPRGYVKPLSSWVLRVFRNGKVRAVGCHVIRASDCGITTIILENEKAPSGGSGGSGGYVSSSGITKTGQIFNRTLFESGVALTSISAVGLVILFLDEMKRRRRRIV